jgi:hypothetical protein
VPNAKSNNENDDPGVWEGGKKKSC